jgi:membrane associated rhomboid family serine protease
LIVLALNLVLGFVVPGVSWQAHIGGLLVGALVAWIFVRTRGKSTRSQERTQLIGVAVGLVAATVARALL